MEIKGKRKEASLNYDNRIGAWFGASRAISRDEMLSRVFRFDDLPPSNTAFIDAVIPGHNRTLMGALGRGTAEEDLKHRVEKAENCHIDYIKAEPGNGGAPTAKKVSNSAIWMAFVARRV